MVSVNFYSSDMDIAAQWRTLAGRASNVFMNPAAARAATATKFADIHVLLAWDESTTPKKLVGIWTLQRRKIAPLWPAHLEAPPYNFAFLSNPVVDPDFVAEVIPAFFAAIEKNPALPNVISLQSFNAESPGYAAIVKTLTASNREWRAQGESMRPYVTREVGVKRSGSTRKKLRQDWNRLTALGPVDILNDRTPADVQQAFESFLALEAGSWKGINGTALLSDDRDAAFARRLVNALAAQGDASVALLRVDGRPIAAQVLMYCGPMAYTWKTAFDSEFGRYSPGALLVDKITEQLFSVPGVEAIDSCSSEGSFMAQIWSGRCRMVDLLVDVSPRRSLGFTLETGRKLAYLRLRDLRNRFRETNLITGSKRAAMISPQ